MKPAPAVEAVAALLQVGFIPAPLSIYREIRKLAPGTIERVNDHVAAPPTHEPRQRLWQITAKRSVLTAGAAGTGESRPTATNPKPSRSPKAAISGTGTISRPLPRSTTRALFDLRDPSNPTAANDPRPSYDSRPSFNPPARRMLRDPNGY